jgi:hypothetical protein
MWVHEGVRWCPTCQMDQADGDGPPPDGCDHADCTPHLRKVSVSHSPSRITSEIMLVRHDATPNAQRPQCSRGTPAGADPCCSAPRTARCMGCSTSLHRGCCAPQQVQPAPHEYHPYGSEQFGHGRTVRGAHSTVYKPQRSQWSACTLQRGCVCARAKVAKVFSQAVSDGPNQRGFGCKSQSRISHASVTPFAAPADTHMCNKHPARVLLLHDLLRTDCVVDPAVLPQDLEQQISARASLLP